MENPNCLDVSDIEGLLVNMTNANKTLDSIQKSTRLRVSFVLHAALAPLAGLESRFLPTGRGPETRK